MLSVLFSAAAQALTVPCEECAIAYHKAVAYLRAAGVQAWRGDEAQAVLLGESILADPQAAGPRQTSHLASLDLRSMDARARRVLALAPLGLDVSEDIAFLQEQLALQRTDHLALDLPTRQSPVVLHGAEDTRLPGILDNALALQALRAAGVESEQEAIDSAIVDLLEFQYPIDVDGSLAKAWKPQRFPASSEFVIPIDFLDLDFPFDYMATAQVILALGPYADEAWTPSITVDPDLECPDVSTGFCIQPDIAATVDFGVFLIRNVVVTPPDVDVPYLAWQILVTADREPSAAELTDRISTLLSQQDPIEGDFQSSIYATALAARALLAASKLTEFAFDTDGDGYGDVLDADDDDDGYDDPVDAFPLDASEWADSDWDGVGDIKDTDDDGDGIPDADEPAGFGSDSIEFVDTDGDGYGDVFDADDDGDDVSDVDERIAGTDPLNSDTDGDGYEDSADTACPLVAYVNHGGGVIDGVDVDGDGVCTPFDGCDLDPYEFLDTDGDGDCDGSDTDDDDDDFLDWIELAWGSDPTNPYSFPDDIATLAPYADFDRDGLPNGEEDAIYGSSPYLADTDDDGAPDALEVLGQPPTSPTDPLEQPPAILAVFGAGSTGESPALASSSLRLTTTAGQATPIAQPGELQDVSVGLNVVNLAGFQPQGVLAQDGDGDGLIGLEEATQQTSLSNVDTDGDRFADGAGGYVDVARLPDGWDLDGDTTVDGEADVGTDPTSAADRPGKPGDVAPLGNPDGVLNVADALVGLRLAKDPSLLDPLSAQRREIALEAGDIGPGPSGEIGADDALIILNTTAE